MGIEEDRRQDGLRLRNVEEAIIEFRVIAKTVVVDHAKRLDDHDRDINELKTAIYQSCDAKSVEFDGKTKEMKLSLLKLIGGVTMLGLSAVIYFNFHVSSVEADISAIHTSQDNTEKQTDKISAKIDSLTTLIHTRNQKEDK